MQVVVIRFGHDWDPQCMQMDEILAAVADTIKNFACIYLVDISEVRPRTGRAVPRTLHAAPATQSATPARSSCAMQVPDFNTMYELYDPCTTMFFFRWVRVHSGMRVVAGGALGMHSAALWHALRCAVCAAPCTMERGASHAGTSTL